MQSVSGYNAPALNDGAHGNDGPAQPLDYAKAPALPWVSRHRKLLIFLAMLIAMVTPVCWYRAPLKYRVLWLYWSHRAAAFQMPEHSIPLSISDALEAKRIASTNPSYVFPTVSRRVLGITVSPTATFVPLEFRRLLQSDPRLGLAGREYTAVAFMGTRVRPDGTPRLVFITGGWGSLDNVLGSTMALVLPLPALSDPIPPPVGQRIVLLPSRGQAASKLPPITMILESGVPDRSDRTRIIFEFADGRGTIEAQLQNDDSLLFRLLSYSGDYRDVNLRITSMPGDLKAIQSQPTMFPSGTTR